MTSIARPTAPTRRQTGDSPKLLLVDDEPSVLSALQRQLRTHYDVRTATDGMEGLAIAGTLPDLAVVVSDMRMPGMDGAQFLKAVRDLNPDVVRILLTGYSELDAAVAAINDGQVFRFLSKPIPSETLLSCLRDAVRQHELLTAERELLERTLKGSVKALVDTLAMANPVVFSRAERVTRRLVDLAGRAGVGGQWEIELAGMLAHLGAVTLPPAISRRVQAGDQITVAEQDLVDQLPTIAVALLDHIPRLEEVREIIRLQRQRFDGHGKAELGTSGADIPIGARLLRVVMAYDLLEARGLSPRQAVHELRTDTGSYDPQLLGELEAMTRSSDEGAAAGAGLAVADLRPGMVLLEDVRTVSGQVLCGRGQQLTERMLELLTAWPRHTRIVEPIAVRQGG